MSRPDAPPVPQRADPPAATLAGIRAGRPATGPQHVHIDITNGCNAACVTCWDHSPHLTTPRPADWKRRRMPKERFDALIEELAALGSVEAVVISGMGEPLTHPDVYPMLDAVKARGWRLTLMTNLVAADIDRLCRIGVDQVLVGVQGATLDRYLAFHPGWTEEHFHRLCTSLRRLGRAGVRTRHVHVIDRHTAPDVVPMVEMGRMFGADRVNLKLASLSGGTEVVAIDDAQRAWLLESGIPAAEARAAALGVATNLPLFRRQVEQGGLVTTPMDEIGCYMGYVYTRVTVDLDLLYCCNTEVRVGSLLDAPLATWWWGERWQGLRGTLAEGRYFRGCDRCGKVEQNLAWSRRLHAAERA